MYRHTLALCGLLVAALVAPVHSQPASEVVLYEGARLIPGDGGAVIDESAFLVDRGVITRVGRKGELGVAGGVKRVDLSGKTVMPALINAHGHPGFQKGLTYSAANYTRENIVDDLNRALYFGVAAVMSQGIEKGELTFEIRAAQAAGQLGGARLLVAGRGIGAPNAGPARPPMPASLMKSRPKRKCGARCVSRPRRKWTASKSGSMIAADAHRV